MPKGKKSKKYKRKSYGLSNAIGGFPSKKIVKLRYAQEFSLAGTGAGISQYQFRCNSVQDPDFSFGGHQPMNFDRWAALYNHYTVLRSSCKITPVMTAYSTNITPGYMGIMVSTDSGGTSALASVTSLFENRLTSHKRLMPGSPVATNQRWNAKGVTSRFNSKSAFGVKDPEDGAAYGALVTTSPNKAAYFNIYLASINGNTPSTHHCLAEIEYTVLFDEPVTQTQN